MREYEEPGPVTLRLAGEGPWLVKDAETGKRVARLQGDQRDFTLDLSATNTRVIECNPR